MATLNNATTKASLPVSPTQGDLNYVTDNIRGYWAASSSGWFSTIGETANVKEFGAKGDNLAFADGAITSGTTAFTTASSHFTSADVGKSISVKGAGASGGWLTTTIQSFTSGTSITLAASASTTVSSNAEYSYGTDDATAIQAAVTQINSAGGAIYLPPGDYRVTVPITLYKNMRFLGAGREATKITKATNTPVAASETAALVCLDLVAMGDGNGDVNCVLWICDSPRPENVEIAHMTLRSNASSASTSQVDFAIAARGSGSASDLGVSECHIHDINIDYMKIAAIVIPVIFVSTIDMVRMHRCGRGLCIENATSLMIMNNYARYCHRYGYYLRDVKYSLVTGNACDGLNDIATASDYSDRNVYAAVFKLNACYAIKLIGNGIEGPFGTVFDVDSCIGVSIENNVCISPQSSYTGTLQVAIFLVNLWGQNISIKNNFVFKNNVEPLSGSADSTKHHDLYVNVTSTNTGFVFINNLLCNYKYESPLANGIYGNNSSYGEFTPTLTLLNATGVTITYGTNNKGRFSIANGFVYIDVYLHIASVTFTGTTNIYPQLQLGSLSVNKAASHACLLIDFSSNVTWASTEPFYWAIDPNFNSGLARNRDQTVALGAGATPSFVTGSTNVRLHAVGWIFVGDSANL